MNELISISQKQWPEKIMMNWRRFSSGLWRIPEGDVSAAYCAEIFPKIKVFTHEGMVFTNCGGHFSGPVLAAANCYPLILAGNYGGPEPRQYSYEGCDARYKSQSFKLGPKAVFTALDATIDECRELLRSMYADGGWFARQSNYELFLREDHSLFNSESAKAAIGLELAGSLLTCSKHAMSLFLDDDKLLIESDRSQPDLAL